MTDQTVLVCGAGAMGRQIAMLAALGGYETRLYDVAESQLDDALHNLRELMARRVDKGRNSAEEVEAAFGRLTVTTDLEVAAAGVDAVIEAIVERLDIKRDLFAQLSEYAPETAVFATNSSSIVSSKLADVVSHPERLCNLHFFNPPLVLKLVELVQGPHTSDETIERFTAIAERMQRVVVKLDKEIFGFVVNRVLRAIFDESIYLYESGIASIEDIDTAVTEGLNHPIGPFALLDLTGIDVNYHIKQLEAEDLGDPAAGPSRTLTELYEAGRLGRKSGRGFYDYGAQK